MRLTKKISLAACAPALLFIVSAATTDKTPQEMKTLMSERGKLLFSDDFSGEAVSKEWKSNLGKWEIVDGALKGTELEKDHHPAVIRHAISYRNAVFQFSFRLDGAKAVNLSLNNRDGHVCRVVINANGFTLKRDQPKKDSPEKAAVLDTVKTPIKPGQWYEMIVEVQGKQMLARIDDSHIGFGKHDGVDVDKTDFALPMTGDSASYDNVRVWEALPKPNWDESKLESMRQGK
ncbi:MAG: hypothetical protein M3Z85_19765 [Acidobacteriota bacterium]|nr:hypothetical protein [Acidobacteriota bacterium]